MTKLSILKLAFLGFMGGFLNSGFGVGSGLVFNPILVQFDLHPAVASGSGMFITMVSTFSSSIVVLVAGKMNLIYALILCIMTIVGTIPGIILQPKLV